MWSDPIADLLTRIRNAARNRDREVLVPRSSFKRAICKVLVDEGFIQGFDEIDDNRQGQLRISLKYGPRGEQVITDLKRVSKAGGRRYVAADKLPRVRNGMGIAVISTNRGVKSDRECRKLSLGGELICTVY
jgi:small subunit ribosomal protein S8